MKTFVKQKSNLSYKTLKTQAIEFTKKYSNDQLADIGVKIAAEVYFTIFIFFTNYNSKLFI